jgi:3-hydroxyisobutyrate dehydrogenase-like beta-hydroxyacid dehydrogenase
MRLGVIGLGNIGGAVAANLVADGHEVAVHDLDAARAEPLLAAGARTAASPAELARRSEVTLASLPTPEAVEAVAADWLSGAAPGSVFVDLSTNAPEAVRRLGARLEAAGRQLLEAPLTGGAAGAKSRTLVFLVGGDPALFERCRPILERLGRASFHLGPLGAGNVGKLVNSLLAFTATWVSLEGLTLAASAGLDLRTLVEAVRTGGASNFFMDKLVEGIGRRGRPPHFALELAAKDARLIVDTALRQGVPAPVAGQIAQLFATAVRAGLGDRDWSDLVEFAERQAGVALALRPPDPRPDAKPTAG